MQVHLDDGIIGHFRDIRIVQPSANRMYTNLLKH